MLTWVITGIGRLANTLAGAEAHTAHGHHTGQISSPDLVPCLPTRRNPALPVFGAGVTKEQTAIGSYALRSSGDHWKSVT